MRQKLGIAGGVIVLILVVVLMIRDMITDKQLEENPYAYELDDFTEIGLNEMCYKEAFRKAINLKTLTGIAVDHRDHIFLVGDNSLLEYNAEMDSVMSVGLTDEARNVHVTPGGKILVGYTNQFSVFDQEGNLIKTWPVLNEKSVVTSIAGNDNFIYLADAGNKRVLKYDLDGELLQIIGEKDSIDRPHGFIIPSAYFDLAFGREDELWVVNSGLHTFEKYDEQGNYKSSWHRTSMDLDGFSGCCNPTHFAMLSDGAFVTSEKGLVRIKIHEPNGDYRCVVARPIDFEPEEKGIDLAVNSKDEIYLIVPSQKEVRKYIPVK